MSEAYAERTIAAYRVHARKAIRNWARMRVPSRFLREFAGALATGKRVVDFGCGIGAELAWLRREGFAAEGLDGTLEFVQQARRRCPGARVRHARFEAAPLPEGRYDGIWCNAALMHVPPAQFLAQMERIRRALRPGGVLGLTLAWGRRKGFIRGDWIPGRYFAAYTKPEVYRLLRGWSVRRMKVIGRGSRQGRWIQILACRPRRRDKMVTG